MKTTKKHRGRPRKAKVYDENIVYDDGRGAYLMRSLGLDKQKPKKRVKKEKIEVKRNPYAEFAAKKFSYLPEDFTVLSNDNFGYVVTHKSWNGTYITNENRNLMSEADANEFIRQYCEDTNKPYGERNLKFHLI